MIKKILIFGAGYVGSSLGVLLAKNYEVVLIDNDVSKVNKINNRQAPIDEPIMAKHISDKNIKLIASSSFSSHLKTTDFIILALPTNYDSDANFFDTNTLTSTLQELNKLEFKKTIVIKSTIPIGFTKKAKKNFPNLRIIFVPEFLREGSAISDNISPSRIVIGDNKKNTKDVASVFQSIVKNIPKIFYMHSSEAEAVKLFANTYLATRISFFNELDSYAFQHKLNSKNIIDGISSDPRIGEGYNNPSFGYGGYCLPKDTKQLLANYSDIPQGIFTAVVESNKLRKEFIAKKILNKNFSKVGIFRLVMKKNSDNYRDSAILDVIKILIESGQDLLVYEPLIKESDFLFPVTNDLDFFKNSCDLVIANRMDKCLIDIQNKLFTRDIFGEN